MNQARRAGKTVQRRNRIVAWNQPIEWSTSVEGSSSVRSRISVRTEKQRCQESLIWGTASDTMFVCLDRDAPMKPIAFTMP